MVENLRLPPRAFLFAGEPDEEVHAHADLDAEDVVRGAGEFRILADVAAEIEDIDEIEIFHEMVAHAVEGNFIHEAVVVHEGDDAGVTDAVGGPADGLHVGIGELAQERGARVGAIGAGHAGVEFRVFAIFVVVVFVELSGVVGRVAEADEDGCLALALDALRICLTNPFKAHLHAPARVFLGGLESIHQADALEGPILAGGLEVFVFDVHRSHVVREQHHLVAVQFVRVFVRQRRGRHRTHEIHDEISRADKAVEDVDIMRGKPALLPKLRQAQQVIHARDHEIHDGLRGIDDA